MNDKSTSIVKNPALLKVIAQLISQSEQSNEILCIKDTFIQHLFAFCAQNSSNKKTILQLSIWQDWLLRLVPLYPNNKVNAKFLVKILRLIRILLVYGICYEYGSWQVFIDTLALIHLHICEERFTYLKDKQQQSIKSKDSLVEKKSNLMHSNTSALFSSRNSVTTDNSLGVDLTEYASCQIKTGDHMQSSDSTVGTYSSNSNNNSNNSNDNSCSPSISNSDSKLNRTQSESTLSYENIELSSLPPSKLSADQHLPSPSPPIQRHHDENNDENKTTLLLLLDDLLCSLENIVIQQDVHKKRQRLHLLNHKESIHSQLSSQSKSPTTSSTSLSLNQSSYISHPTDKSSLTDINVIQSNEDNQLNTSIIEIRNESPFIANLLHIISYLSDMIIGACGGLLPLLAAASSSTGEIGSLESVPGMELSDAISYLLRLTYLADFCVLDRNYNLKLLESERNLAPGSVARQLLRLYLTVAVRNCLESRLDILLPPPYIVKTMKQLASGNDIINPTNYNDTDDGTKINEVLFMQSDDTSHTIQSIQIITGSTHTTNNIRVDKVNHYNNSNGIDITLKEFLPKYQLDDLINNQQNNILEDSLENSTRKVLNLSRFHLVIDLEYYTIHRLGCIVQPWTFPDYFISSNDLFRISDMKEEYDKRIEHLSGTFQQLLYSIKPYFNYPKKYGDDLFQSTVICPIEYPLILLQNSDLKRLHLIVTRYAETAKSPEFLALATVYFLSVMMVSKYRDFLDPNPIWLPYGGIKVDNAQSKTDLNRSSEVQQNYCIKAATKASDNTISVEAIHEGNVTDCNSTVSEEYELVDIPLDDNTNQNKKLTSLTDSLDISLGSIGSFLKDLFIEFMDYFTRTLVGTHGQELIPNALPFFQQSSSVIELVMLLCSQEWQTSLQKYAGWAFIELVNEGRLLSHSVRDHLYRVALKVICY
ncbi:unnamed protein product [Heterobilharzia americana]|nr:unnamed protein product [Heterobilharzia americana]